jgi:thiol-disulfide isomerase/thioredoxin
MGARRLLIGAAALALLGAGPPQPIELRTLAGESARITRAAGEPDLVLHFWATWCADCAEELPSLASAARACDPARVHVLAVNAGEAPALVKAYLAEHAFALPVLLDPGGRAWRQAGFFGLPANLIWTSQGVSTSIGPTSSERWRERLAGLGCAPAPP